MNSSKETRLNSNGFELSEQELLENTSAESQSTAIVELQESRFKLQVVEKLREIDKRYKQGVMEYKESIHVYNIEIEKLKNQITLACEDCAKEEKTLLMMEHELVFEDKSYDNLQVKFSQIIFSIEDLKYEYKDVLEEVRYDATLKRKEKELFDLLDDIEVLEISLLNKELLRIKMLETFAPKKENLKDLERTLKELEMKKSYFESMGLHKVSNVQLENQNFRKEEPSEVVDTIEVDA